MMELIDMVGQSLGEALHISIVSVHTGIAEAENAALMTPLELIVVQ